MNSIPKNELLNFHEDTLISIRKDYGLDKPGRMDESIDALVEWIKKQDHFVKKDFGKCNCNRLTNNIVNLKRYYRVCKSTC